MINMEHPSLPVELDAPPVQLWVKKIDSKVHSMFFVQLLTDHSASL